MTLSIRPAIARLPMSATLQANEAAAAHRRAGRNVLHMGFGQAPFPVHPLLLEALGDNAGANLYEHVAGVAGLRQQALAYFANAFGVDPDRYDLVVAPGSKLILYALQMAVEGDVIVPVPSWVSYVPQAKILGDKAIPIDARLSDAGYRIDPETLGATIARARAAGANPTKLILNSPNNPTGLCLPQADHAALAEVCEQQGVMIVSDEIYALVSFDEPHRSIAAHTPTAAITTGLSKHLSLGGWRIGFGLIPREVDGLFDAITAIASETWSSVSAPVQRAAVVAVSGHTDLEDYVTRCTAIHRAVARYVATAFDETGVFCPRPAGAFYLWPDFTPIAGKLAGRGMTTSQQLADVLLERYDVLALPGTGCGAASERLCLRLSVCDYDGALALKVCDGVADPADVIGQFAPRVVAATKALREFATS